MRRKTAPELLEDWSILFRNEILGSHLLATDWKKKNFVRVKPDWLTYYLLTYFTSSMSTNQLRKKTLESCGKTTWVVYNPDPLPHHDHAYFSTNFQLFGHKDTKVRKVLISLNFIFSAFHEQVIVVC